MFLRTAQSVLRPFTTFVICSAITLCPVMLSGCKHPIHLPGLTPEGNILSKDEVAVFFSQRQGEKSVVNSVPRKLPAKVNMTPVQYAVVALLQGPTSDEKNRGFYSEIPSGSNLLGIKSDEKNLILNLSHQFTSGGGSNSMLQRFEELKQTVYALDHTHKLTLSIEGKPLEVLGGEGLEVQEALKRDIK